MEQGLALMDHADDATAAIAEGDYIRTLLQLNLLAETFTALAGDVAQAAYNKGYTKKRIAAALNVPASTFRGMERQVTA